MQFPASDAGFRIGLALHVISLLDYACVEGAVLGKGGAGGACWIRTGCTRGGGLSKCDVDLWGWCCQACQWPAVGNRLTNRSSVSLWYELTLAFHIFLCPSPWNGSAQSDADHNSQIPHTQLSDDRMRPCHEVLSQNAGQL